MVPTEKADTAMRAPFMAWHKLGAKILRSIWPVASTRVVADVRSLLSLFLALTAIMLRDSYHLATLVAASVLITLSFSSRAVCVALENGAASNGSLLWGPYRPNLYFGVRPRIPRSLLAGLMWAKVDKIATVQTSEFTARSKERTMFLHAKDFLFRVADLFRLQIYLRTR
jgi:Glycosyl hydrolase family 63 N-terminal domain